MKNSYIFKVAMILFCVAFLITGTVTHGDRISDLEDKKDHLAAEKAEIQSQLKDQEEALEANQAEMAEIVKQKEQAMSEKEDMVLQLEHIFESLQQIEATIIDTENEYNKKVALLRERAQVMYQLTDYTTLQMFIESDSLLDFLNRQSYYDVMIEKDRELIQEVENLKKDLEIKKKVQLDNQVSYEKLLKEKEAIINSLEGLEADLSVLSDSTKAMIDKLEAQEKEMEAESKQIEAQIKALEAAAENSNANKPNNKPSYTGGKLLWPSAASHYISSYFGMRFHPIYHYMRMHNGIDIAAAGGTNILAAESGTVIEATYNSGYGNYIVIYHGNGVSTLYAHSSRLIARVGDYVSRGEVIALVGTTGNSTGNHLHFEVRINGTPTNPLDYL